MILILAEPADPWATLVHRELLCRGEEDLFWIQRAQLLNRVLLNWPVETWSPLSPGSLVVDGTTKPLNDLTGVFARLSFPLLLELEDLSVQDRD